MSGDDLAILTTLPTSEDLPGVSLEVCAVSTPAALENLKLSLRSLVARARHRNHAQVANTIKFISITWKLHQREVAFELARFIQGELGIPALLHVTCAEGREETRCVLAQARENNIRNVLLVRGDELFGEERRQHSTNSTLAASKGRFAHAIDLVAFAREQFGDYFTVGVAGYPEVHTECYNSTALPPSEQARTLDLLRLKAKVAAGADFVISQFFYDAQAFLAFTEQARAVGIEVPIIPGYMPIHTFQIFNKFTAWCNVRVPRAVQHDLEKIKEDDAQVKAYGVGLGSSTFHTLMAANIRHFHIFTLNMVASSATILEEMRWIPPESMKVTLSQPVAVEAESGSRPIFWANRAAIARGDPMAEFPNGRFTVSSSPALGELSNHYFSAKRPKIDRRGIWGVPSSVDDVKRVFVSFLEGVVPQLPWCDSPPDLETGTIFENLRWINKCGYLTINSQPRVNGARSDDPRFGWGGPDGVVYQKAYIEFFVSPNNFAHLLKAFPRFPSLTYHAMNNAGKEISNCKLDGGVNAVTWGVFPGKEILQPTVVDPSSFRTWKDEAFRLWLSQWASVYNEDTEADSAARKAIQDVHDSYWLVNIVDNDYVSESESIFSLFREVITDSMSEAELRLRVRDLEADNTLLREALLRLQDRHAIASTDVAKLVAKAQRLEKENDELRAAEHGILPASTYQAPITAGPRGLRTHSGRAM